MATPESLQADLPSKEVGTAAHDEEELANFGYKQELNRDWGLMHNFGISFSIIVCSSPAPKDFRGCPEQRLIVDAECDYGHHDIVQLWA